MIDHVDLLVHDLVRSRAFYVAALKPLGYTIIAESETSVSFGIDHLDDFGINQSATPTTHAHVAFASPSREAVDAFYHQALAAGGRDNVAPRIHPEYHATYYAAYVYDPDDNNIEAVHHGRS
ncbi:MAG: VOC family protein [Chloroflexota bacterium]|nr:VOC family protein [Chloroflexota bacterium]